MIKLQPKISMTWLGLKKLSRKAVTTVGQLNELAHEDIILLIDHKTKEDNVALSLQRIEKRA